MRFRLNDSKILDVAPNPEKGVVGLTVFEVTRKGELAGAVLTVNDVDVETMRLLAQALHNIVTATESAARSYSGYRDNPKNGT